MISSFVFVFPFTRICSTWLLGFSMIFIKFSEFLENNMREVEDSMGIFFNQALAIEDYGDERIAQQTNLS